eukprot:m.261414 g.261414  ORF g.261414 m.261414 type:complete len:465 (+) comp17598_c0_seq5:54-1448(+)
MLLYLILVMLVELCLSETELRQLNETHMLIDIPASGDLLLRTNGKIYQMMNVLDKLLPHDPTVASRPELQSCSNLSSVSTSGVYVFANGLRVWCENVNGDIFEFGGDGTEASNAAFGCDRAHRIAPIKTAVDRTAILDYPLMLAMAAPNLMATHVPPLRSCITYQSLCTQSTPNAALVQRYCPVTCRAAQPPVAWRWLCEDSDCNTTYRAACYLYESEAWEMLFTLNPYDTSTNIGYTHDFWTNLSYSATSSDSISALEDRRYESYVKARSYTEVGVAVMVNGGKPQGLARYGVRGEHYGSSMYDLITTPNGTNTAWTGDRTSYSGQPMLPYLQLNVDRTQTLYGDLFADYTDGLMLNREHAWGSTPTSQLFAARSISRLSTALASADYHATFAGVGGLAQHPQTWNFTFEYAPISAFCGEAGLFYGPEDQYAGINGAQTPSDCADSGVPSYIPVLVSTAVLVR